MSGQWHFFSIQPPLKKFFSRHSISTRDISAGKPDGKKVNSTARILHSGFEPVRTQETSSCVTQHGSARTPPTGAETRSFADCPRRGEFGRFGLPGAFHPEAVDSFRRKSQVMPYEDLNTTIEPRHGRVAEGDLESGGCTRGSLPNELCERANTVATRSARTALPKLGLALPESLPMGGGATAASRAVPPDYPVLELDCALGDLGPVAVVPVDDCDRSLASSMMATHHPEVDAACPSGRIRYRIASERYGPLGGLVFGAASWHQICTFTLFKGVAFTVYDGIFVRSYPRRGSRKRFRRDPLGFLRGNRQLERRQGLARPGSVHALRSPLFELETCMPRRVSNQMLRCQRKIQFRNKNLIKLLLRYRGTNSN